MTNKSYLFRVHLPNGDNIVVNKRCLNDENAIEQAKKLVAACVLNSSITVLRIDEIKGMKHKQWVGKVEHVVRRTF